MPKADLSDVITALNWADRQIDVLSAEFTAFTKTNPYVLTARPRSRNT